MLAEHHTKFGTASLRRRIVELSPDPNIQALKDIVDVMETRSKEILKDKRAALQAGDEAVKQQIGEGKDIISILREYFPGPTCRPLKLLHSYSAVEHGDRIWRKANRR